MAGCAKMKRGIAGMAMGGVVAPNQETWVEQRSRETAELQPKPDAGLVAGITEAMRSIGIAGQNTNRSNVISYDSLHEDQQRNKPLSGISGGSFNVSPSTSSVLPSILGSGIKRTPIAGLADGGIAGRIPGKVNPKIADDVTINAKKGEYILSVDDVALLGGPDAVDAMVKSLRKQAGLPTKTGPKTHDQPDSLGRMDKPGLPARRGIAGLASGGPVTSPYKQLDVSGALDAVKNAYDIVTSPNFVSNGLMTDADKARVDYQNSPAYWQKHDAEVKAAAEARAAQNSSPSQTPIEPALKTGNVGIAKMGPSDLSRMSDGSIMTRSRALQEKPALLSPIATTSKIAPGMESIGQTAVNVGLPIAGTSLGTSTGGPSIQLDGNKGLGDTTAISNRVDWSPGSANMRRIAGTLDNQGRNYNEQVAHANAVNNQPKTADQQLLAVQSGNTSWSLPRDQQAGIAGANFNAQQKNIADDKSMAERKYAADTSLAGQKYAADAGIASQGIAGAAHVQAAEIGALGREAAARAELDRDAAKQQRADEKESRKNMETRIQDHLKSQGADFADPHNAAKAQQYYKDTTNWATKTAEVFNSSSLMKQYHPLYQKYVAADPKQRAEMEKDQSIQGMIQTVKMLGLKHGVDPFSRPAPPAYRVAPIKAAQLPIAGMEGVQ